MNLKYLNENDLLLCMKASQAGRLAEDRGGRVRGRHLYQRRAFQFFLSLRQRNDLFARTSKHKFVQQV